MTKRFKALAIHRLLGYLLLCSMLAMVSGQPADSADESRTLTVFAASSLAPPLDEIAATFEEIQNVHIRIAYGSSATLARQIAAGAPADLFLSAHEDWLEYLLEGDHTSDRQITFLAANRLVLAAPAGIDKGFAQKQDLRSLLLRDPAARIAVGAIDSVPLGKYTREALQNLGLWQELSPRLAPAANARRALAFVSSGATPLGILYASDAQSAPGVDILAPIPECLHSPIRYWSVVVGGSEDTMAVAFQKHLAGEMSKQSLAAHGFIPQEPERNACP